MTKKENIVYEYGAKVKGREYCKGCDSPLINGKCDLCEARKKRKSLGPAASPKGTSAFR